VDPHRRGQIVGGEERSTSTALPPDVRRTSKRRASGPHWPGQKAGPLARAGDADFGTPSPHFTATEMVELIFTITTMDPGNRIASRSEP